MNESAARKAEVRYLSLVRKESLLERSREGSDEIDRAISIGSFSLSPETHEELKKLRNNLQVLGCTEMSFFDLLDKQVSLLEECIDRISDLAMKNLQVS